MRLPPCDQLPSVDLFWNERFPDFGDVWRNQDDPDVKAVLTFMRQPICCIRDWWEKDPRRAVIATIMWGYPDTVRGRMTTSLMQSNAIGKVVLTLKAESLPAATLLKIVCGFKDMGPSTASKLLFMASVDATEGPCLIYDQRVVRSIAKIQEDEFLGLRSKAQRALGGKHVESAIHGMQGRTYGEYLKAMHASARRLDCDPLRVEQFLFHRGGNELPRR